MSKVRTGLLMVLACSSCLWGPQVATADLKAYVQKPEPVFRWELVKKTPLGNGGMAYDLKLVSQEWQKIVWEHDVQVIVPKGADLSTVFIWNQGGKASAGSLFFGSMLAEKMHGPVAMLFGIPNQPLLGGKTEDALIAETFVRFLESKDPNWPLLFPMVKSVVKCMDALQEFSEKELNQKTQSFVLSGGSKRGWTTWLTGSVDPRIKAIAPLVIDTLNMQKQMPHQLEMFGAYSEMIGDYTSRGLVPMPDTPEARQLWSWVDPWVYRTKLTMPKLIVNGANDPYWTVDALNLYWDDLPEPKWVIIVPNAGHNLEEKLPSGQKNRDRAVNGLSVFTRLQLAGKSLPKMTWQHRDENGQMVLSAATDWQPRAARLWSAHHATKDHRKATWEATELKIENHASNGGNGLPFSSRAEVPSPSTGYKSFYLEFEFEYEGLRFPLCTQVRVAGK